jgi:hypothetical protein
MVGSSEKIKNAEMDDNKPFLNKIDQIQIELESV